mmetsp:Transcript_21794/g.19854  ORF Transcript_21794/g.19854 Transcript_21794/m.19854 type:complete len:561 (-) Transcript_21794:88-1770(-)|eukprot:CAMPEP_0196764816 /NCGR_PEP_ID=MMETSP1095-20130614/6907_1 /TAXON_ID=96789 ORGANISM="Chromulina nebulosa, Strain UTEXLB2642" /NCGR_SAMPLE_ID=MMETSP1095 /ASSEMBLY_ACC=CAM_ASM_000446 /LENGTH=560 /DNA_ID=CAMNT_0042121315 /DNA_START=31 /DNA_END=1713 /DNA_ORIENTATION=-
MALPQIIDGPNGALIDCRARNKFNNWGLTVRNTPEYFFAPKTVQGIKNLVKWAGSNGYRVRCNGFRHTWGNLYADDTDAEHKYILVSMLKFSIATDISIGSLIVNPLDLDDPGNELIFIEIVNTAPDESYAYCKIGAATSNEYFRKWCADPQNGKWTIPMNVILVEITFGGSNAMMCHGAGWKQKTLSDIVVRIDYIDAYGNEAFVTDPVTIKSAAGCFGLLGVVTFITIKLDSMSYAYLDPQKVSALRAVPYESSYVSDNLIKHFGHKVTPEQHAQDILAFNSNCEKRYSEFFWFVLEPNCWVNCWDDTGAKKDVVDYPPYFDSWVQNKLEEFFQLANHAILKYLPAQMQIKLINPMAMLILPSKKPVTTYVSDALHFRHGIHQMRVRDMEVLIPIPTDRSGNADWNICRELWWKAISLIYEFKHRGQYPIRLVLEMRIMGGSDATMAPEHGNTYTCAIEVLTPVDMPDNAEWQNGMQTIYDGWCDVAEKYNVLAGVRPHWAKDWANLKHRGVPIVDHLKNVYGSQITIFKNHLQEISGDLDSLKRMFSNKFLDDIIFG